jgi:XTP/dITP diphosphohydrolase
MKKLLIATSNKGKFKEYTQLLAGLPFELVSMRDMNINSEIEENYDNYRENALHKAVTCGRLSGLMTLADDSGLEVDALEGEPGVRSARYAGDDASDAMRVAYLLDKIKDVPWVKRTCRFVCVIAVAMTPEKTEIYRGQCDGYVTYESRGENGFGYDPIFYFPKLDKTMAELETGVKNKISHRAIAAQKAYKMLESLAQKAEI